MERLTNPTVGLAAHPGRVDIRVTAKAASEQAADERLADVEATLRSRLTDRIYGVDVETLEAAALWAVAQSGWKLAVVEAGTGGALSRALSTASTYSFIGGEVLSETTTAEAGRQALERLQAGSGAQVGLLLLLRRNKEQHAVDLALRWPGGAQDWQRTYGGAPLNAADWATSLALDTLRRHLPVERS